MAQGMASNLTITQVSGLRFPSAFRYQDNSITVLPVERGAAVFQVSDPTAPNIPIVVTITTTSAPVCIKTTCLTANNWLINAPAALDQQGNATVMVGGTIATSSGSAPGKYTGSAILDVSENSGEQTESIKK